MNGFGFGRKKETHWTGTHKTQESTPSKTHAIQLSNALRAKRKLMRSVKVSTWEKEFDLLANEQPHNIISTALTWYCANIGQDYVPEAYSAKSFRLKFPSIISAMSKKGQDVIEPSKEALRIVKQLQEVRWPATIDGELERVVEISLRNYASLIDRLKMVRDRATLLAHQLHRKYSPKKWKDDKRQQYFKLLRVVALLTHLIPNHLGEPARFVFAWMMDANSFILSRPKWTAGIGTFVFREDSPRWHRHISVLASEYSHDSRTWREVLEMMRSMDSEN